MGKRGPKPVGYVPRAWTPEWAYVTGLFAADGCLSGDGRHIDFTSKDKELVEIFRKHASVHTPISKKGRAQEKEKRYFRAQFSNVNLYNWFFEIGFTPAKSMTLGSIAVPDKYFFDFLRGVFDGDGTIYAYWDPRWHSSYMFYISFTSGSKNFLEWIDNTTKRLSGVKGGLVSSVRCWQLRYAKGGSRDIVDLMYSRSHAPCLSRKFAKIQKIFKIDDDHMRAGAGS